ncbi:hypothetical protein AOQ84DRAFT_342823 [Glonium stellatum]|uniref:GEgh 16 protein n=1 Tax=Glonium stellatum TaxID=574774 RepID=A0A8E2EXN5_9PEZI|nr:hypothetical protein AOQ84DRAFT_342823 [Glonium stellatum]
MFFYSSLFTFSLLATSQLVAGHGAIIAATGDAGGNGTALGIDASTPRTGTTRQPFQQDTTRFKGDAAATCGETLLGGDNDAEAGTAKVLATSGGILPQINQGGKVQMTLHQVNGDGAGPYTCMIDATGTGTQWTAMTVTTNVPGKNGRNNDGAVTDFPLTAAVAADQTCTGTVAGQSNVCMVRCQNPARAGPFGGCVPVQMIDNTTATAASAPAAATGNATAAATTSQDASDAADEKRAILQAVKRLKRTVPF